VVSLCVLLASTWTLSIQSWLALAGAVISILKAVEPLQIVSPDRVKIWNFFNYIKIIK
jgi:hypothetical protein